MKNRMKNVGILSALCVVVLSVGVLSGCNPGGDSGGGTLLAAEVDTSSSGTNASVAAVQDKTTLIDSATVTVNAASLSWFFFAYVGTVLPTVNKGDPVTLHFVYKDIDIQKTLTMPDKPTIAPPGAGPFPATNPINLTWTNPPTGTWDNIVVSISSVYTVSSDGYTATLAPAVTSYNIPANTLKSGQTAHVIVEAVNSTTDLGSSVMAGSGFQVANQDEVDISTP